jgi:hypothetical protein
MTQTWSTETRDDEICPKCGSVYEVYSNAVISEGFREWEDSRRELDLLAIDKEANLVVIELKRTEDGGHAELQAIRYAAMVSAMTFARAVEVYQDYLHKNGSDDDATESLLEFLSWEEPDEDSFAQDVRIVLVSADFSKELTTSVMWLNQRDLDIRCVRMCPYRHAMRKAFWQALLEQASVRNNLFANVNASRDSWISAGSGISGVHYAYVIRQHTASVQLVLEAEKSLNKARFDWFLKRRDEIEKDFVGQFDWQRCDDLKKSYFSFDFECGYRDTAEDCDTLRDKMIAAMSKLEAVINPLVGTLRQVAAKSDISLDR